MQIVAHARAKTCQRRLTSHDLGFEVRTHNTSTLCSLDRGHRQDVWRRCAMRAPRQPAAAAPTGAPKITIGQGLDAPVNLGPLVSEELPGRR